MNKRGISGVIVMILLVVLGMASVIMMWGFVKGVITSAQDDITVGLLETSLMVKKAEMIDSGARIKVLIKRGSGGGNFSNLSIVLSDGKNSQVFITPGGINELEMRTFSINLSSELSGVVKVEVFPVKLKSDGKEVVGKIGGSTDNIIPVETTGTGTTGTGTTGTGTTGTGTTLTDSSLKLSLNMDSIDPIANLAGAVFNTVVDDSTSGNNGIVYGAILDANGKYGKSLSFSSVNDYVGSVSQSSLGITNDFTFEVWIYLNPLETDGIIFGNGELNSENKGFSLGIKGGKIAGVFNRGANDWSTFTGNNILSPGVWHNLILSYSGTTAKLYLDGVEEYSGNVVKWTDNTKYIKIGNVISFSGADSIYNPFDGSIDEVHVWNRALTAEEITSISTSLVAI